VEESPFRWDSPEQNKKEAEKKRLPVSLQKQMQVPIRQETDERGYDTPPEEELHNPK
jgi:hypothetical protein